MLATLVRTTGSLELAEDAVQDAVVKALETWPRDGVPREPRAWLTVAARHRALDLLRREAARTGKEGEAVALLAPAGDPVPDAVVADDLLRLVFTCCHPSLSVDTQVALALRTLGGLTTAEVARALLVPEATMGKRLTRARSKIALARIPYRVPDAADLPARVAAVVSTVYLVFNEGYSASSGEEPLRRGLVDEAVRLARLLVQLLPDEPSVLGLLALLLLQDARSPARIDADGEAVLLRDQDRSLWRQDLVREGLRLLSAGLSRSPTRPDPYVVQAALAACHALAPTWAETDWAAVVSWYDVLLSITPTPVVALNRAVALGERDGARAGLAAVDGVAGLAAYPLWHAARAELLARLDRPREAVAALDAALGLPQNRAQRHHLERRRAALAPGGSSAQPSARASAQSSA